MSKRKPTEASGKKRLKPWQKNLIFAVVVLLVAGIAFFAIRKKPETETKLVALVDFGDGITETLPLDEDYDYLYDVGDYVVHIQVKDGAAAFRDHGQVEQLR